MTLQLMQYTRVLGLFLPLLPSALAADDAATPMPPAVASDPCSTVSSALNVPDCPWEKFAEMYLGATVNFPTGLFVRLPVSSSSTSKVLFSGKGEMVVSVWSASTNARLSPQEAMTTDLYNAGLASVTYRKADKSGYSFAGKMGSRSLLKRRVFSAATPGVSTTVCVTWPSGAAGEWSELASAISRTLKPGIKQTSVATTSKQPPQGRIATCQGL